MRDFLLHAWDVALRFIGAAWGLLGGGEINALCILMALDYGSGLILALQGKSRKSPDGNLSARASFQGLMKKGMMMGVILLAAALDLVSGQDGFLRRAATGFYICNEGISLLENTVRMGVPVPKGIKKALEALRESKTGLGNEWIK